MPAVLFGFLLPCMWGVFSRLLQQGATAAPYLEHGVAPLSAAPDLGLGEVGIKLTYENDVRFLYFLKFAHFFFSFMPSIFLYAFIYFFKLEKNNVRLKD